MEELSQSIYRFSSYLDVLIHYRDSQRARLGDRWSLGTWSRKLGIRSTGTLSNYLSGRKVPELDMAVRLAQSMDLDPSAAEYFVLLTDEARIARALRDVRTGHPQPKDRMRTLLTERRVRIIDDAEFKDINDPELFAMREAFRGGREGDADSIAKRFTVEPGHDQVERAMRVLADKNYERTPELLATKDDSSPHEAIREFHGRMLRTAEKALETIPAERRNYTAEFFTAKSSSMETIKERVREFRRALMTEFEDAEGDVVVTLGTYLFPMIDLPAEGSTATHAHRGVSIGNG